MDREKLKELAAAYCLGALDGEDKTAFEELLQSGDPLTRQFYTEMQETASLLPYSAHPVAPPAHLKESILASVVAESSEASAESPGTMEKVETSIIENLEKLVLRWKRMSWAITIASVLLLAGTFWYFASNKNQIITEKEIQIAEMQAEIDSLQKTAQEKEYLIDLVQKYENVILALNRVGENLKQANVKVVIAPNQNKAVFIGSDLKTPPTGKVYLLWKLQGPQPINAGVWQVDEDGNLVYEIANITGDITDFAVTIEERDGAEQLPLPTSDIELHVKI